MEDYLDEMLHLTADIAEELLTIKDTGRELSDHTAEQIARLAELAVTYRMEMPVSHEAQQQEEGSGRQADDSWAISTQAMPEVEQEMSDALEEQADEHETAFEVAPEETAEAEKRDEMLEADNAIAEEEADADGGEEPKEEHPASAPDELFKTDFEEESTAESTATAEESKATEEETTAEVVEEVAEETHMPKMPLFTARDLRNAFTLNDVFLYQRTLFHGSSAEFKSALEEITTFTSVDELKDYLATVHHTDLKSAEAEQFVATVSTFFV